jgi:ketosteroid isomerase-like protein
LGELKDRDEIKQLIATYTAEGDRGRVDAMAWIFADDAKMMTSAWIAEGRAGIVQALKEMGGARKGPTTPTPPGVRGRIMRHHLTSCYITFDGPDEASGRTYWINFSEFGPDHSGLYADKFRRIEGRWKIVNRDARRDWVAAESRAVGNPAGPRPADAPPLPIYKGT